MGRGRTVRLVTRREVRERLRSTGFRVATLLLVAAAIAAGAIPALLDDDKPATVDVGVVGTAPPALSSALQFAGGGPNVRLRTVPFPSPAGTRPGSGRRSAKPSPASTCAAKMAGLAGPLLGGTDDDEDRTAGSGLAARTAPDGQRPLGGSRPRRSSHRLDSSDTEVKSGPLALRAAEPSQIVLNGPGDVAVVTAVYHAAQTSGCHAHAGLDAIAVSSELATYAPNSVARASFPASPTREGRSFSSQGTRRIESSS